MKCKKCKRLKPLRPDGICKRCHNQANVLFMRRWRSTPKGIAANMWTGMTVRADNRNGKHPAYANIKLNVARADFMAWVVPELDLWLVLRPDETADYAPPDLESRQSTPSVNRKDGLIMPPPGFKDGLGHYELGNIELLPQPVNSKLHAPLTADRIAQRVRSLCQRTNIDLATVLHLLKEQ